jgi:magnesium transporter
MNRLYAGGMGRTRLYRNGVLEAEDFPEEDISEHVSDESAVVWLDLCRPTAADFAMVREEFGLHALAIEDATSPHERPKLDLYKTHLFLSAYAVRLDRKTGDLNAHEVSAFISKRFLITVRKDDGFDIEAVVQRWDQAEDLIKHGVPFLVYGLLDEIIDQHFSAVQNLDQALEELEDLLFEENHYNNIRQVQQRSFRLRKSLVLLRRVVLPMREVVNGLMRPTSHLVEEPMVPYYQDVYDHVLRASEWTESLRDFVTTILETNLSMQANRANAIMKKVTSWAAIIAVPTAITGFYGQNVPFPGFSHQSGFISSSVLIVVLSVGLYVTFKHNDWL